MWKEARLVEQRNKEGVSFRDFVLGSPYGFRIYS